jgi:hypothetical protein
MLRGLALGWGVVYSEQGLGVGEPRIIIFEKFLFCWTNAVIFNNEESILY